MSKDGRKKTDDSLVIKILGGVGAAIVMIVAYFFWVNSHAFEGSFLGMTFKMPLETTEHYCSRKAEGLFTIDTDTYEACLREASSKTRRHNSLVNYLMNLFKDDTTSKTVITVSQAECMAKKIEAKLTEKQIDEFIKGKSIGDQLGLSTGVQVMNDVMQCLK